MWCWPCPRGSGYGARRTCQPRTRRPGASGGRLNSGRERIALAVLLAVADRPSVGERRRPPDIPVQALPRMREDDTPRIEEQGAAAESLRRRRGLTRVHFAKPYLGTTKAARTAWLSQIGPVF